MKKDEIKLKERPKGWGKKIIRDFNRRREEFEKAAENKNGKVVWRCRCKCHPKTKNAKCGKCCPCHF